MIVIHYPTAFKALNEFIDQFNAKTEKGINRLRTGAVMTAKEIIRIYGISLLKANGVRQVDPANIPSLQTNNKQLAKLVKCSPRTIQRHILKLQQVGIIKATLFHGSNSNYELWMNPQILLIKQKQPVDKVNEQFHRSLEAAKQKESGSINSVLQTTNCPHTYSCNTSNKRNNIIIAVNTVDKKRSSLPLTIKNQASYATGDTGNTTGNTGEIAKVEIEKQKKFSEKNVEEAGEIASRADQSEHRNVVSDPARDNSLKLFVGLFWLMARNLLYKNVDLTDNQVQIAKKLIHKLYEPSTAENISNFHQAYTERISIVYKYLQRDPKRFVPLPYIYFDLQNPYGFIATKEWHKKHLERKKEIECELALSRSIRKYTNNEKQDPIKQKSPMQLFRECENTLGKLGGTTLSDRFCAAVIEHETFRNISSKNLNQ